jgi:hypothetical protein
MLRFSDGENFDTSGNLRIEVRKDGMYVMGEGLLIPVKDEREAHDILEALKDMLANRLAEGR